MGHVFYTLFKNKRIYLMHNESINSLESLEFKSMSHVNCKNVINGLSNLKDEIYYDLQHFGIDAQCYLDRDGHEFSNFIENYFVLFINKNSNLKSVSISGAVWRSGASYLKSTESILKLLCNIPIY